MERDAANEKVLRDGDYAPGEYETERGGGYVARDGRVLERWWRPSRHDLEEPPGGHLIDPLFERPVGRPPRKR